MEGAPPPFWLGGSGSPSNTMSSGSRPISVPSGILIHVTVWPQLTGAENWEAPPTLWGGAGCPSNTKVAWDEVYVHTKFHLGASNRLATIEMDQRLERAFRPLSTPFWEWCWVPIWHNEAWTKAHLRAKCGLDPSSHLATLDMGRELGRSSAPFWGGGAGSPSNTKLPGPRPTSIPSGILMHPALWRNKNGPKIGGLSPFGERGAGSTSSTTWPGPRPTSVPSALMIHPVV